METINIDKIDNKQKLLAEVCLAAKYEGESITLNYPKYQTTYGNFPFELCTVLARRFADIGDIIRGKDLFYGNTYESARREKLENKLKEVFGKIHGGLSEEAKKKYQDGDGNYYQLREDWWYANRRQVWKAITCDAKAFNYFRNTCNGESPTKGYCRCNDDQPNADKPNTDQTSC